MRPVPLFIDGAQVLSPRRFPDINPATGDAHAEVCEADAAHVDRAVRAAKKALAGPWGRMSVPQRADLLEKVALGIEARAEDFLRAEIEDTGKPRGLASIVDIPRGAANFRAFAHMLRTLPQESFETATDDGRGAVNLVVREPLGVVGVICPWNLPLLLMTWKVAPALAAGNTVVVKPSEETPQTAALLGEVMKAVGVPDGVYNVVHGFGPGSAGEFLVQHEDVAAITFTGESRTGAAIMASAAPQLKRLSFELGGKNPGLVFADCDLDAAVDGTLRSTFLNTGQVCLCTERLYVERSIYPAFLDKLAHKATERVLGDPFDPTTTLGPLISSEHMKKVAAYFDTARKDGATVVTGGSRAEGPRGFEQGYWVEPTLWTGVNNDATIVREEIFGPCAVVIPFDDEEEGIALANDSDYGLCAAIWTQNLARAHRVARKVEAGLVWVNTWYLRDLRTPFGGMKKSGIGREGGRWSFDFYAEPKNICIKL